MKKETVKHLLELRDDELKELHKGLVKWRKEAQAWVEGADVEGRASGSDDWSKFYEDKLEFYNFLEYRIVKNTHWVNGHEVEAPLITDEGVDLVYCCDEVGDVKDFCSLTVQSKRLLEKDLAFRTEQGAVDNFNARMDFDRGEK
jgi:hypothetical protein